jgi:hypothetical protein
MLKNNEVRRLFAHLQKQIDDKNLLAEIEDNLLSEDGNEIIREPEFLQYFSQVVLSITINKTVWTLNIIPYTRLRLIQRNITQQAIINLFTSFVEICEAKSETVTVGAHTIFDKSMTLRIDVDEISDEKGFAHTVTVFVGKGNTEHTISINTEQ